MNWTCHASPATAFKYGLLFPAIQIAVNLVPLVAIITNRKRLVRLKSAYIHVANTLVANIILALFIFYIFLNFVFVFERPVDQRGVNSYIQSNPVHRRIMMWWTFQKSFVVCTGLVMCFSVVGLIYGLEEKNYFPRQPSGTGVPRTLQDIFIRPKTNQNTPLRVKMRIKWLTAAITASITWLLPIALSLLGTFSLNCIEHCRCLPAYYDNPHCLSPDGSCSVEFLPISNTFLTISISSWFLVVILLMYTLYRRFQTFRRNAFFASHPVVLEEAIFTVPIPNLMPRDLTLGRKFGGRKQPQSDYRKSVNHMNTVVATATPTKLETKVRLSPTMKLVIFLTFYVIASTLPLTALFMYDVIIGHKQPYPVVVPLTAYAAIFVYGVASPILLTKYLSELKEAMFSMVLRCDCTLTTTRNEYAPHA